MCGICGFTGNGNQDDLSRMNRRLTHRGPDSEGIWTDKKAGVYLGHRRLSIIDLQHGSQPMWTPDGRIGVIFNGEIYNHEELRKELISKGHSFKTSHSDTEVLLHGYRQWGKSISEHLNGMWAFAIYDRDKNQLLLSRDRFGKKPLFYTFCSDTFIFASELTSLREHSSFNPKSQPPH